MAWRLYLRSLRLHRRTRHPHPRRRHRRLTTNLPEHPH
jgi:hypothetical protein